MLRRGEYTVHGASVRVRVLKVYYQSETKIAAKLQFVYKSGIVLETKQYNLKPDQITHWVRVD